jgi:hypothetical protein
MPAKTTMREMMTSIPWRADNDCGVSCACQGHSKRIDKSMLYIEVLSDSTSSVR